MRSNNHYAAYTDGSAADGRTGAAVNQPCTGRVWTVDPNTYGLDIFIADLAAIPRICMRLQTTHVTMSFTRTEQQHCMPSITHTADQPHT